MGFFSGLKDAKVFDKGTPLKIGIYELEITKTMVIQTQAKGPAFIAEFKVVASSNPEQPVGSSASWYQGLLNPQVAMGAMKEFLATLRGYDLRDPEHKKLFARDVEPYMEAIGDEAAEESKNVYKGRRIKCETIQTMTKGSAGKPPGPFTRHSWSPVTGQPGLPLPGGAR